MISIADLKESEKGKRVNYRTHDSIEYGRITSWNEQYVFVRYFRKVNTDTGIGVNFQSDTSQATKPEDLEWA